jgi:hypothetical protein
MRQIWPDKTTKPSVALEPSKKSFNFTKGDWDALQAQINELQEQITTNQTTFEEAMQQLAYSITTRLVTAENLSVTNTGSIYNALIGNLNGTTANINDITTDTITVAVRAAIERLTVSDSASINEAQIGTATITTLNGDTASFDTVSAYTYDIDNFTADDLTSTKQTTDTLKVNEQADINEAVIDTETVGTSTVDNLSATTADISTLNGADSNLENIANEFTTHNNLFNKQVITNDLVSVDGDYWIVLPKLKNGNYYLVAKSRVDNAVNWTMEITNSLQNTLFRWGVNKKENYLSDVEIVQDESDNSEFIQIHAKLYGETVDLYHKGDDYDTTEVPVIWAQKQYDGVKNFKIERSNGMYMPNATFAGEFHAESIVIDNTEFETIIVDKAIVLPSEVDQYGQVVTKTSGSPGQYIANYLDEHGNIYPKWTEPASVIERDNLYNVSSDTVSKYDGEIVNPDYDPTDPTSEEHLYPVTNLGNNTTVHGNETVEGNIRTKHIYDGAQADMPVDMPNQSLVIFDGTVPVRPTHTTSFEDTAYWEETGVVREYNCIKTCYATATSENPIVRGWMGRDIESNWRTCVFDGTETYDLGPAGEDFDIYLPAPSTAGDKLTRKTRKNNQNKFDELAVYESTFDFTGKNNEPVIYDEANNSLKTSKDVTLGDVTMDELVINKDLHVKGDAFVEGTLHTVEEETITSTGDNLVLRQNNPSSLGNDTSGIIVNNYDGNGSSLELATSSDGTLKVGTGTPTTTTYLNIYKSRSDDKWYSDATLTTEVTPVGYLASWEAEDTTDDYIHYEHAVFADLSATLEPIMTRDEEANLNDRGLLVWDTDDTEAKTIALPTNDEDELVPTFVPDDPSEPLVGKWTYSWQAKKAGVYTFATMTDYETYAASHNVPDGSRIIIENEDTIVNSKEWPDHV